MSGVKALFRKPQGYIRFVLCVVQVLGSAGLTYYIPYRVSYRRPYYHNVIQDVTLMGGSTAAFTLLAASTTRGDNRLGEILYTFIFMLLNYVASWKFYHKDVVTKSYKRYHISSWAHHSVCIGLFGGAILWTIDFLLSVKDSYQANRGTGRPAPAPEIEPQPETSTQAEPKTKQNK